MKRFTISACLVLAALPLACSSAKTEDEMATASAQSVDPKKNENEPLFCAACFEQTEYGGGGGGGGGPASPGGGFIGAVMYGSDRATPIAVLAEEHADEKCPPEVDCVTVHGLPRDKTNHYDWREWVTILGDKDLQRVDVKLPPGRTVPEKIKPPKARVWKCPVEGVPCQAACTRIGAGCDFEKAHPHRDPRDQYFGKLTGCKTTDFPNLTHTCTYRYVNGDICTEIWPFGSVGAFLCDLALP